MALTWATRRTRDGTAAAVVVLFSSLLGSAGAADVPREFVTALAHDGAGNVWIGTESDGRGGAPVIRVDAKTNARTHFAASDIGCENVYALCADKLGRIWAGHTRGVSVYAEGVGWKSYDVPDGPLGERIFCITACPTDGSIWIGTNAGITVYSVDHDAWHHITRIDGLPSGEIQSLAFDPRGNLYVGSDCFGVAISTAASHYQRWRYVTGSDALPLTPAGSGLPSSTINQIMVARDGTVYLATPCGLAASKDQGKNFSFVRGADWGAKVRGLYGGAPRGWKQQPATFTLLEDYCTWLAEDESGLLWVGHWRTGYEVVDPNTLERVYPTGPKKADAPAHTTYVRAILPRISLPPLIGWYGGGVTEAATAFPAKSNARGAQVSANASAPARPPGDASATRVAIAGHPSPAAPPSLDELNTMLAKLGSVPILRSLSPTVIALPDDWRTQDDCLGRYGRYWSCHCAICSPHDYVWGAGAEPVLYSAQIGPNHPDPDDSMRYWVHSLYTGDQRSLEIPPTYFDSRVIKGLTTPERNRRQAEWDDHSEAYAPTLDGPDLFCSLKVPAGQFYLSIYDFNKDGHDGANCLRDYRISIHRHGEDISLRSIDDFNRQPELAAGRIRDFWGGVWKRFYVQGPMVLTIRARKNNSLNTIVAGVALDLVDERPAPYFCTLDDWKQQMLKLGGARKSLLSEPATARASRLKPLVTVAEAADRLFDELEQMRLRNTPWWAAESRPYYAALLRLYRRAAAPVEPSPGIQPASSGTPQVAAAGERLNARLATCCYQLQLFAEWEGLQRADKLKPARDIEKSLRWDEQSSSDQGKEFQIVTKAVSLPDEGTDRRED